MIDPRTCLDHENAGIRAAAASADKAMRRLTERVKAYQLRARVRELELELAAAKSALKGVLEVADVTDIPEARDQEAS